MEVDTAENKSGGSTKLDMVKLLGRLPFYSQDSRSKGAPQENLLGGSSGKRQDPGKEKAAKEASWSGSGLGVDWDEMVGAGRAAASIVSSGLAGFFVFSGGNLNFDCPLGRSFGIRWMENCCGRSKAPKLFVALRHGFCCAK